MEKTIFASDLDNTLLFSWKHAGDSDVCVELLNGEPQGYLTGETPGRLTRLMDRALFVPVTSRSVEQYLRIQFPAACRPKYAVTSNGGVLLVDGEADGQWLEESQRAVAPWQEAIEETMAALEAAPQARRCRVVDGMYAFAACDTPEDAQALAGAMEGKTSLNMEVSGRKAYFFPPPINKGEAVRRLRARFQAERVICAGDTTMDVPMLEMADLAIAPEEALVRGISPERTEVWDGSGRFYDFVLLTAARYLGLKAE